MDTITTCHEFKAVALIRRSVLQTGEPSQRTTNHPAIIQLDVHTYLIEPNTLSGKIIGIHSESLLPKKFFPALFDNVFIFFNETFCNFRSLDFIPRLSNKLNGIYRKPGFAITVSNVDMNQQVVVVIKQKSEAKYSKNF